MIEEQIVKLYEFRKAFFELKNVWSDELNISYPFKKSFDELYIEVDTWFVDSLLEYSKKRKEQEEK